MRGSLQDSEMDLHLCIQIGQIPLAQHHAKLQGRIPVLGSLGQGLGFGRESGKQYKMEAMKEGRIFA